MNPLVSLARIAGVAVLTAVGIPLVLRKFCPRSSDLAAGAIHFGKGINEFQKGFATVLFGSKTPSEEETARKRAAARIPID